MSVLRSVGACGAFAFVVCVSVFSAPVTATSQQSDSLPVPAAPLSDVAPPRQVQTEVGHAFLRAEGGVHGEVSVARSSDGQVVETLLYSRVLKRVVAEIALRESDAWPPESAAAGDSAAYVEALRRAQKKVWWESARDPTVRDRVQEMAIEFAVAGETARVSFFAVRTRPGEGGRRRVVERRLLETLPVTRQYALRDQRLIVEDTFGLDAAAAAALLGRASKP